MEVAREAFDTFNLDLMYALPGQTPGRTAADLAQALAFAPPHLSIYHLTIEPNTYFAKHPPVVPDDDAAIDMLDRITESARRRRVWSATRSRPMRSAGHRCVHNLNYWQFGDYLGIGAGAHSKLSFAHRVVRQVRYRDPAALHGPGAGRRGRRARRRGAARPAALRVHAQRAAPERRLRAGPLHRAHRPAADRDRRALDEAEAKGWSRATCMGPADARGFDFLSDLQSLFLPG